MAHLQSVTGVHSLSLAGNLINDLLTVEYFYLINPIGFHKCLTEIVLDKLHVYSFVLRVLNLFTVKNSEIYSIDYAFVSIIKIYYNNSCIINICRM